MLDTFGNNIWLSDGSCVRAALGFHYPTRMAIIRLPSGDLFVWSPVQLRPGLELALSQIGPVRHIVAPNSLHDSFLSAWQTAYPEAAIHAAPDLAQARPDIRFRTDLTDTPDPAWEGAIDQVVVPGNAISTEVVFFHRDSGTVLFADLLQQLPRDWFRGWRRIVARLDLMTEAEPSMPRKFRLAFRDRKAARAAIARIKAWPAECVVIAHGQPVRADARGVLRRAFRWLDGPST